MRVYGSRQPPGPTIAEAGQWVRDGSRVNGLRRRVDNYRKRVDGCRQVTPVRLRTDGCRKRVDGCRQLAPLYIRTAAVDSYPGGHKYR